MSGGEKLPSETEKFLRELAADLDVSATIARDAQRQVLKYGRPAFSIGQAVIVDAADPDAERRWTGRVYRSRRTRPHPAGPLVWYYDLEIDFDVQISGAKIFDKARAIIVDIDERRLDDRAEHDRELTESIAHAGGR